MCDCTAEHHSAVKGSGRETHTTRTDLTDRVISVKASQTQKHSYCIYTVLNARQNSPTGTEIRTVAASGWRVLAGRGQEGPSRVIKILCLGLMTVYACIQLSTPSRAWALCLPLHANYISLKTRVRLGPSWHSSFSLEEHPLAINKNNSNF